MELNFCSFNACKTESKSKQSVLFSRIKKSGDDVHRFPSGHLSLIKILTIPFNFIVVLFSLGTVSSAPSLRKSCIPL